MKRYQSIFKEEKVNYKWHLPSKEVLHTMYEKRKQIGGFVDDYYWSSSEYGADLVWA